MQILGDWLSSYWLSSYWLPAVLHGGMLCAAGYVYVNRYKLLIAHESTAHKS